MVKGIKRDLRDAKRFGLNARIIYEPSVGMTSKLKTLAGRTVNVSRGGFCIKTEKPLTQSQIIRIHIPLPKTDVASPTLAEVCWVERLKKQKGYSVGLRFLL